MSKQEQKVQLMTIEMKKMEVQVVKMQEQMKRVMGLDKLQFLNGIE